MKRFCHFALIFLALLIADPASAGTRVALIIANAQYQFGPALRTPTADATLIAQALRQANFTTVTLSSNATKQKMEEALRDFGRAADGADVAVIYYAGHGIEVGGQNYLIPIDARLAHDREADLEAVRLESIRQVVAGAKLRLIVLDACRNNPFVATMSRSIRGRGVDQGLAKIETESGEAVLYSTREGTVASDGADVNSPFAKALAKRLVEPGLEIGRMIRKVHDDVFSATGKQQEPFTSSALSGEAFFFVPEVVVERQSQTADIVPRVTVDPLTIETLTWQGALAANSTVAYQDYLTRYPHGIFSTQARANIDKAAIRSPIIKSKEEAVTPKDDFVRPKDNSAISIAETPKPKDAAIKPKDDFVKPTDKQIKPKGEISQPKEGLVAPKNAPVAKDAKAEQGGGKQLITSIKVGDLVAQGKRFADAGDYGQAIQMYQRAADAGNPSGMVFLGLSYENGRGLTQNFVLAAQWYRRAADLGDPNGMSNLGVLFGQGHGVMQDFAQAAQWFRRAAEAGNTAGMSNLGIMYENGRGVARDFAQASAWYRKSAEAGDLAGMANLGFLYENGRGVIQDYAQAMKWYRRAADLGSSFAMSRIGEMYSNGWGVPPDKVMAAEWSQKAQAAKAAN